MLRTALLGCAALLAASACATGIAQSEDSPTGPTSPKHDAGSNFATQDSGGNTNPIPQGQQDSGSTGPTTTPCTGTMCSGQCVDTTSDSSNCGACGKACPSGASCSSSMCQCTTGTACSGSCVDTMTDNSNCGTCGNACMTGQTCTGGTCSGGTMSGAPPQGSCGHSLCSTGAALTDGCDTAGCTSVICDVYGDTYCCGTKWDSTCVSEVTSYCSPYSCP